MEDFTHIVVTHPKGDKHVQTESAEGFWLKYNQRVRAPRRVKINRFASQEAAEKFAYGDPQAKKAETKSDTKAKQSGSKKK